MKSVIFSEKVDFSCFGGGHPAGQPPSWLRERRRRVAHFPRGENIRGPERGDRRPRAGGPEPGVTKTFVIGWRQPHPLRLSWTQGTPMLGCARKPSEYFLEDPYKKNNKMAK